MFIFIINVNTICCYYIQHNKIINESYNGEFCIHSPEKCDELVDRWFVFALYIASMALCWVIGGLV